MHIFRLFGALLQKSIQATSKRVYEKNERKVVCPGGGLFLRGRKHRHTFPRGPTIQCLFIKIRTISYNNSCQRIVRNYLQGHSTEIPFLSNVFKKSAIFQAKNFFSFMFHSLNRHPNQTQLPRTPSQHNKDLYSNEVAHIKSSRK